VLLGRNFRALQMHENVFRL